MYIHKVENCVQKQLKDHFLKFKYLKNYPKMKKKDTYWREYNIFVKNCSKSFDMICDSDRLKDNSYYGV